MWDEQWTLSRCLSPRLFIQFPSGSSERVEVLWSRQGCTWGRAGWEAAPRAGWQTVPIQTGNLPQVGPPRDQYWAQHCFNILKTNLDDGVKRTLMKFASPKLSGKLDTSGLRATLQENLDRLKEWATKNTMKLTRTRVRSCSWESIIHECSTGWGLLAPGEKLSRKEPGPGGQAVEYECSLLLWQRIQQDSGLNQQGHQKQR